MKLFENFQNIEMEMKKLSLNSFCLGGVKLYRVCFSPLKKMIWGPHATCRFYPTCSEYAMEALRMHSFPRAVYLIVRRLLRCHPWHMSNVYDPVPLSKNKPLFPKIQDPCSIPVHARAATVAEHRVRERFRPKSS